MESSVLFSGVFDLPWWGYVLAAAGLTHITIVSVTVFLHRCQAHRALDLHPLASHFFRLWLWMTTGMVTKEWAAIHRKHHAKCETAEDPHSPQTKEPRLNSSHSQISYAVFCLKKKKKKKEDK